MKQRPPLSKVNEIFKDVPLHKKVQEGQVITITSRGHEMARLVPVEDKREKSREILRELGKNATIGDILSPIYEEWEAMK